MRRNVLEDQKLLVEYSFWLGELPKELARTTLMLRVANGTNTVLYRLMKLMLRVQETGVESKQQTFTSIGLVAFDDSVGLPASMHQNILDAKDMILACGGKAEIVPTPFEFEGCDYTEVRLVVYDLPGLRKLDVVKYYSALSKKCRELNR